MRGAASHLPASAAPILFVLLWSSGFIGAKLGLPYAEPMTFLAIRMIAVVGLLGLLILATRPSWPSGAGALHSVVVGLLMHGCYLGGVFVSINHRLPTGLAALVVALQPILTATMANRLLGERVGARQWVGLLLGVAGVYLVVQSRTVGDTSATAWIGYVRCRESPQRRRRCSTRSTNTGSGSPPGSTTASPASPACSRSPSSGR